jgi:hypothetical protein
VGVVVVNATKLFSSEEPGAYMLYFDSGHKYSTKQQKVEVAVAIRK